MSELLGWECLCCHSQYPVDKKKEAPNRCPNCNETLFLRIEHTDPEIMYEEKPKAQEKETTPEPQEDNTEITDDDEFGLIPRFPDWPDFESFITQDYNYRRR